MPDNGTVGIRCVASNSSLNLKLAPEKFAFCILLQLQIPQDRNNHTMIISDKNKFIFIAVPKTATTSIENALSEFGEAHSKATHAKHIKASELMQQMNAEQWNSYFKFAFVRHPLD
jgi:hypothetical protein